VAVLGLLNGVEMIVVGSGRRLGCWWLSDSRCREWWCGENSLVCAEAVLGLVAMRRWWRGAGVGDTPS